MANAVARPSEWLPAAVAIVAAVTAWRVAMLAFARIDLFVDEAQYWFWGQELAFGYYSKPPMIGWVIRASTEIGGSDAAFWVRLPGPLFHAATALVLGWIAAARYGRGAAIWVAAIYVTLPMVSVASILVSTDTVMFPFLAAALGFWLRALDRGGAPADAALAGALAGIGFLGKYAAIYMPLCAGLAALLLPAARPGWRAAGIGAAAFLLAISPNLVWNLANGLTTLQHTLDNADWVRDPAARAGLNLEGLASFFFSQFAVFGPVLFGALLWLAARGGAGSDERRLLLLFSLPILVLVCGQALLSEAYANWAVAAYLAGTLAVVPWLAAGRRGWLWASLALHLAFAVLLPVAAVFGTGWRAGPDDRLVLERYLGRSEMSRQILALAEAEGLPVVADNRHVLADLFHTGRDSPVPIWALPEAGRPSHHYALVRAMPETLAGDVLFVTGTRGKARGCPTREILAEFAPQDGAYRRDDQTAFRVPAGCLRP